MINQKSLLLLSLVGALSFTFFLFATEIGICKLSYESCFQRYDKVAETLFIFIPTLALSLLTYKMREEIFESWLEFAYVWVPLSIILTFLAPEYDASLVPITKSLVSFSMSATFLFISLIIIFLKHQKLKK